MSPRALARKRSQFFGICAGVGMLIVAAVNSMLEKKEDYAERWEELKNSAPGVSNLCGPFWLRLYLCHTVLVTKY
eukprot:COSAG01_NODE_9207_length_2519_cov_1.795041_2_plen_75_part_00